MNPDRAAAWKVALIATLFYALGAAWGVPYCKTLVCADRILRGEVPYRDFWSMYAPGQFYAAALSLAVFGRELWVQALTSSLVWGVACAQVFLLVREQGASQRRAVFAAAWFALATFKVTPEWSSYGPALLLLLVHWRGLLRCLRGTANASWIRIGIPLGGAAIFKHDVAAYAALASTGAVLLRSGPPLEASGRAVARIALGALLPAAPVILLLAIFAGKDAWTDLIVFPATEFRHVFGEPYPSWLLPLEPWRAWFEELGSLRRLRDAVGTTGQWAACLAPQWVFLTVALRLVLQWRERGSQRAVTVLGLSLLVFFFSAAHVQKNTHLFSMALVGLGLLALESRWGSNWWIKSLAAFQIAASLCTPAMGVAEVVTQWPGSSLVGMPSASGIRWSGRDANSIGAAAAYLREHLEEDEPFYSGLARHDAVVIGNQRFYWLTGNPPCTRYNELHPGYADSISGQQEIIASLEQGPVRYCVLWSFGWSSGVLDSIAAKRKAFRTDLGAKRLDFYIAENYAEEARFGEYRIMCRR